MWLNGRNKDCLRVCLCGWGIHATYWAAPGPQLQLAGQYTLVHFQQHHPRPVLSLGCLFHYLTEYTAESGASLLHLTTLTTRVPHYRRPHRDCTVRSHVASKRAGRRYSCVTHQIHAVRTTETTEVVDCTHFGLEVTAQRCSSLPLQHLNRQGHHISIHTLVLHQQ